MELASQQVAPQLCCALARLCGQTTQGGRAFAAHIFKECRVHLPHSIFTWCHADLAEACLCSCSLLCRAALS